MVVGILIGPILQWIDPSQLDNVTPYFGKLALMIILFEGGLHLNFSALIRNIGAASFLGMGIFLLTIAITYLVGVHFLEMPSLAAIMIGATLGGTSSAIVIPLVNRMTVSEDLKTNVNMESVLTDIFVIIGVMVTVQIALQGKAEVSDISNKIAGGISIALVVGIVAGVLWVNALTVIQKTSLAYMTTLAMALILYSMTEIFQGSGAIVVFVFGMVLSNADRFLKLFDIHKTFVLDEKIELFHTEWTFFIRTYFFVLIGLMCIPERFTVSTVKAGCLIFGACVVARFLLTALFSRIYKTTRKEWPVYFIMMPRGLAAAIVAGLPYEAICGFIASKSGNGGTISPELLALRDATQDFAAYTIIIILLSNLFTVIGVFLTERRNHRADLSSWASR
ncbi:MAG: hypothetical protein A2Z34_04395 [Planctomycetes bacterium RBG_16_59_8]|nr:MAG: hypothetical protein A2Z34_04395 [Planctomycetes bacterium RBG_16_59_8]